MQYDGLIFDLDGTLWDSCSNTADAFNQAFEKYNLSKRIVAADINVLCGKPANECDQLLLAGIPDILHNQILSSFEEIENNLLKTLAPKALYEGVADGLKALSIYYPLYLVSNCGTAYLKAFHQFSGVGYLFKDLECFGNTQRNKASNIQALVNRQNLTSPCYIGDTAGDEQSSIQAGVPYFHVNYGFGKATGEPKSFGSFGELTKYFIG